MFKRYMVFEWSGYDNPDPFDCVRDSFDSLTDAMKAKTEYDKEALGHESCIFDRIEGVFVKC